MIVEVKRYDFVKGVVTTHNREISDAPPSTPLTDYLANPKRPKFRREKRAWRK